MRGDLALARASNLLGYKEYTQLPIIVLNTHLTDYLFPYETNERVGRDNMLSIGPLSSRGPRFYTSLV